MEGGAGRGAALRHQSKNQVAPPGALPLPQPALPLPPAAQQEHPGSRVVWPDRGAGCPRLPRLLRLPPAPRARRPVPNAAWRPTPLVRRAAARGRCAPAPLPSRNSRPGIRPQKSQASPERYACPLTQKRCFCTLSAGRAGQCSGSDTRRCDAPVRRLCDNYLIFIAFMQIWVGAANPPTIPISGCGSPQSRLARGQNGPANPPDGGAPAALPAAPCRLAANASTGRQSPAIGRPATSRGPTQPYWCRRSGGTASAASSSTAAHSGITCCSWPPSRRTETVFSSASRLPTTSITGVLVKECSRTL
jgi:hypothetical protein